MITHPRIDALTESFAQAEAAMRDLPLYNPALRIEAYGFAAFSDTELAGILFTPWFMNLVLLPMDRLALDPNRYGEDRSVTFPAGPRRLRYAGDADLGAFWATSLHSPMDVFASQDQARAEARLRLSEAMTPPRACPGRRTVLGAAG